ncbi:MAG: LysM peptidoglycan-binding domain-containing protein [Phycisphaerales bacterium]|nr:LysM peptidoglycan-binding domain-containing protein [Phycisphaerales bacterium]
MSGGSKVFAVFAAVVVTVVAIYYLQSDPTPRTERMPRPNADDATPASVDPAASDSDAGRTAGTGTPEPADGAAPVRIVAGGEDGSLEGDLPPGPGTPIVPVDPGPSVTPGASADESIVPAGSGLLTESYHAAIAAPRPASVPEDRPETPSVTPPPAERDPPPATDPGAATPKPAGVTPTDPKPAAPKPESPRPAPAKPVVVAPAYTTYTVRENDTASSIAEMWFGDPNKWDLIAKANPFVDINRLKIDQELRLPPKNTDRDKPTVVPAPKTQQEYVVRSGDTLSSIAKTYYADASLWSVIYDANRAAIGDDPGRLIVGRTLVIPPAPKPATPPKPAAG